MRIHKLEDGDIIKILPMIDKNNKISWIKQYDCVGLNTKTFISDTKGYLKRISLNLKPSFFKVAIKPFLLIGEVFKLARKSLKLASTIPIC